MRCVYKYIKKMLHLNGIYIYNYYIYNIHIYIHVYTQFIYTCLLVES